MVEMVTKLASDGSDAWKSGANDSARLGRILLESIPSDRKQQWAGKVMTYIAAETIQCASEGDSPLRISTKTIYSDLGGNPNQEPSAWLSPLWNDIDRRFYPEIEETLIERCREAGLEVYPVIKKGDGKPAYYWLGFKEIPGKSSDLERVVSQSGKAPSVIHYKKDLTLQLSAAGQVFFSEGMKWTPLKRYSFITWQLLLLIAIVIYVLLIGLVLWYGKGALNSQHLVLLAMGIGFPWWAYRHVTGVWRLFEDRIIIAPEWMLAWKEFGATIEITRSKSSEAPSTIHVNRYSATCPTCGWMVKLEKGEPDFPRRIVGRCEENPREHVFTFDRSSKLGFPLRAMPLDVERLPPKEL
jgi:hypothetical protein